MIVYVSEHTDDISLKLVQVDAASTFNSLWDNIQQFFAFDAHISGGFAISNVCCRCFSNASLYPKDWLYGTPCFLHNSFTFGAEEINSEYEVIKIAVLINTNNNPEHDTAHLKQEGDNDLKMERDDAQSDNLIHRWR